MVTQLMPDLLEVDDGVAAPAGWWSSTAPDRADLRHTRAWAIGSRWAGDRVSLVGRNPHGPWTMVRRVTDGVGYSRMNAVDVCAAIYRGVEQPDETVTEARRAHREQLVMATTGYATAVHAEDGFASTSQCVHLLRDLFTCADDEGRTPAVAHVPGDRTALIAAFTELDLVVGTTDVVAEIDLPGNSITDYLTSLGHKRRGRLRRELRAVDAVGGKLRRFVGQEILEITDEAARLQVTSQRARGGEPDEVSVAAECRALVEVFGDAAAAFVAFDRHDRAVASCIAVVDRHRILPYAVGVDHDAADEMAGYFNVVYYEPMRFAYQQGARTLLLGPGSLRPKLLRGARLRPLYTAVRRTDAALVELLKVTDEAVRSLITDPTGHVFKGER